MSDLPQTFVIAPARRRMMVFNMVAYAIAGLASFRFWQSGEGNFWIIWAGFCGILLMMVMRSFARRSFVARATDVALELTTLSGTIQSLNWADVTQARLDPSRRMGSLAYRHKGASEDQHVAVSLRMMGPEAARSFVSLVWAKRPDLRPDTDISNSGA